MNKYSEEANLIRKYTIEDNFSNDIVRKVLFSYPEIFKSFLGNFDYFAKHFDDIESVEQEKDTLINIIGSKRDSDCIWKVKFKNGQISFVWIIIEFQTKTQYEMAFRVAEYTFSLLQYLVKKCEKTSEDFLKKGNSLPLIFPVVLFSGDGEWNAPLNIKNMYNNEIISTFDKHIFSLEYVLIKEQEIYKLPNKNNNIVELVNKFFKLLSLRNVKNSLTELREIHNYFIENNLEFLILPAYFSLLSLIRKTKAYDASAKLKNYMVQNLDTGDSKMVQSQIQDLIDSYDNDIFIGEQRGRQAGIQSGILLGEQRGEQNLLSKQLTAFFKVDLTDAEKDIIKNSSPQLLEKWGTNFMYCKTLQDVFNIK